MKKNIAFKWRELTEPCSGREIVSPRKTALTGFTYGISYKDSDVNELWAEYNGEIVVILRISSEFEEFSDETFEHFEYCIHEEFERRDRYAAKIADRAKG